MSFGILRQICVDVVVVFFSSECCSVVSMQCVNDLSMSKRDHTAIMACKVPILDVHVREKMNEGYQMPSFLHDREQFEAIKPPAVVRSFEEFFFAEHTEKELNSLRTIQSELATKPFYNPETMDEWAVARYAIARKFDTKKTLQMIEASVKWRAEKNYDTIECEKCLKDPNRHFAEFVGWDREHRPVMISAMGHAPDRSDPQESIVHSVQQFNNLIRHMPVGVTKWISITDFNSYSYWTDTNPKIANAVTGVMADHFPERLGKMILVDPPSAFWVFWKVFSPFIDQRTKDKVVFVYTESKPSIDEEFDKLFPPHLSKYLCDLFRYYKKEYKERSKKKGAAKDDNKSDPSVDEVYDQQNGQ